MALFVNVGLEGRIVQLCLGLDFSGMVLVLVLKSNAGVNVPLGK